MNNLGLCWRCDTDAQAPLHSLTVVDANGVRYGWPYMSLVYVAQNSEQVVILFPTHEVRVAIPAHVTDDEIERRQAAGDETPLHPVVELYRLLIAGYVSELHARADLGIQIDVILQDDD